MWCRVPVGTTSGNFLQWGYTPPSPSEDFIQNHWNFLGTFASGDTPPGGNSGPISDDNYTLVDNGYDYPRPTDTNAGALASGPWDPPPIIFDDGPRYRPTGVYDPHAPDTQWPTAWNGIGGRWWGKYYDPGTPPDYADAGFKASPDGGPKRAGYRTTVSPSFEISGKTIGGIKY